MITETTTSLAGLPLPRLVSRLVEMLEYALNDLESEELTLEVTVHGMAWEEDGRSDLEDDENPGGMFNEKYLGDSCVLDSEEFSTTEERCAYGTEPISREDVRHLIALLSANNIYSYDREK